MLLPAAKTVQLLQSAGIGDVNRFFILTIPAAGALLRRLDLIASRVGMGAQYAAWGRKGSRQDP